MGLTVEKPTSAKSKKECAATTRMPADTTSPRSAASQWYMSANVVVPVRIISTMASLKPPATSWGVKCCSSDCTTPSQVAKSESSQLPRISVIAECVWALTKPGSKI